MTDLTAAETEARFQAFRIGQFRLRLNELPELEAALDTLIAASRRAFRDEAFTLFRAGCNDANRCDCGEICTRCHRLMELEQGESCKAKAEATEGSR